MIGTLVRAPKPLQGSTQRSAKSVVGATLKAEKAQPLVSHNQRWRLIYPVLEGVARTPMHDHLTGRWHSRRRARSDAPIFTKTAIITSVPFLFVTKFDRPVVRLRSELHTDRLVRCLASVHATFLKRR
jgi:hypothetical protein